MHGFTANNADNNNNNNNNNSPFLYSAQYLVSMRFQRANEIITLALAPATDIGAQCISISRNNNVSVAM